MESGVICPITCQKKSCRFSNSKNTRRVMNMRGLHFTFSLSNEDQPEPCILWGSGLSYVWEWISYSCSPCGSAQWSLEGSPLAFALCPSGKWITGEIHSSSSCFCFFMWHQPSPSSGLLSREQHRVLHFLPHSWWARSKHIERRLHLECGEFFDLTILHFSPE